jgi:hypothetical protein
MEKVTQGTAATAEESAAASEELNAQAEASMDAVGRLSALVDGAADAAAPSPASTANGHVPAAASRAMPAKVVALTRPKAAGRASAEEQFSLEDTGTFGSF